MIYSVDEIFREGTQFPPTSELERLDAYRVNGLLCDDDPWTALPEYERRVKYLLSNFNLLEQGIYFYTANHWSDMVEKMQELIYGDPPEITAGDEKTQKENATIKDILYFTKLIGKAKEGVADFTALGDWVTKIVPSEDGRLDFINVDPATWFPVVSRENVKEVKAHVLVWVAPVGENSYELHAQVHERGKYTNRAFAIKDYDKSATHTVGAGGQRIVYPTCCIGKELKESRLPEFKLGEWPNGLSEKEFAIVASANNAKTRRICGTSDFDRITEAAMEYNVRMTLKNVVLDKHSAPKLYGPPFAGDDSTAIGNYLEVPQGAAPPAYLVWDASMQSVENTINGTLDDVANLSGMGSLLSSKTFGESQGYDALMIKLSPALMRTAGKRTTLETHLKKLVYLLSGSYGGTIEEREISVLWKDGIPTTESVRADIAKKHLDTGWSVFDVLTKDYGWTKEQALASIEQKRAETPSMPMFGVVDDSGGYGNEPEPNPDGIGDTNAGEE